MIGLKFAKPGTLLCLGAHSDDIEIGCGGTVLELARQYRELNIWWVVFSANGARVREAKSSARAFLKGVAEPKVIVKNFRNGFFPAQFEAIKEYFEELKRKLNPDLVFSHYRDDRHQDHRVLSDLAWNTFRDHVILEYEIPKYDGDLGNPNLYMKLEESLCRRKSDHICKYFQTQGNKHWFSPDTFLALMRLRGIECASPTKYAEAFYCRKLTLG
ncbi:MAG TPA: PIG-L deacetylase family protein [Verrucomicrobiae bacterium]|nr:PIG-L deacetylase family protein [Verrucomicrobiae bacterium]